MKKSPRNIGVIKNYPNDNDYEFQFLDLGKSHRRIAISITNQILKLLGDRIEPEFVTQEIRNTAAKMQPKSKKKKI